MPHTGHIALAGAPNVGKSSLLNALVGTHLALVSPRAQATRLPVVGLRTDDSTQYILHDLPGLLDPGYLMQSRMRQLAVEALPRMDVVLHLHPGPDAPAPDFSALAGLERPLSAPVVTVYTKGDLLRPEQRAALGADAIVVSSEKGQGLERLLSRIREHLPEAEFAHDPDDVSTQQVRFFVVEYLREAAFELLGDELPYAFHAEVEEFREGASPVYIRATLYVERDSQKGILIGHGGATIRSLGASARRRIEELIGAPVYLDCWVKVLPNWRRSAAALARFGFPDPPADRP